MRSQTCFILALFGFGLVQSALGSVKQDPVPDWVLAAAARQPPAYPSDTDAVVLLDDLVYTVAPDGTAVEHSRHVVKILRPQGREYGIVSVPYDKDSAILSMHVWSIGPDGHQYAVKDKELTEFGYPGQGNLFEDLKIRSANPPGRDPGGVIAFEYEQKMHPYVTEKTWFFQEEIPRLSQSFTLELPPGFTYGSVWAHAEPLRPTDLEHQRTRWQIDDTRGIKLEHIPLRPAVESLAGRMTVHYTGPGIINATDGTWRGVGEWYQHLAANRLVATPEIAAKANELVAGRTDFYDRAEAIAEFVQSQIRYFVIEVGIGGFQPHFAGDIFRNHYGDCKDKATLLSTMLSSVGIHSALVLVDTERGVIDPKAPATLGNHMIDAIEIPAGYSTPKLHSVITTSSGTRYLIFDPTWEKTPFGQIEHNLQGGYGVLLDGNQSQVIQFPLLSPELNSIRRTASFVLQPDGSLSGTITEKRFGDLSERPRAIYTMADEKRQNEYLDHTLGDDFSIFTVSGLKVQNAASLNQDLTTTYSLSAERFGRSSGPLLMVRPRVFGSDDLPADGRERHVPIDLPETSQEQDNFTIEIPAGYVVDEIPDPVKLDLGFASYESRSTIEGNRIHYTRTYTVREVMLPVDRYADVQTLSGVIAADEQATAVLKKK